MVIFSFNIDNYLADMYPLFAVLDCSVLAMKVRYTATECDSLAFVQVVPTEYTDISLLAFECTRHIVIWQGHKTAKAGFEPRS
jgi:hypothetical protein